MTLTESRIDMATPNLLGTTRSPELPLSDRTEERSGSPRNLPTHQSSRAYRPSQESGSRR